jgi:hypothetical protein
MPSLHKTARPGKYQDLMGKIYCWGGSESNAGKFWTVGFLIIVTALDFPSNSAAMSVGCWRFPVASPA